MSLQDLPLVLALSMLQTIGPLSAKPNTDLYNDQN